MGNKLTTDDDKQPLGVLTGTLLRLAVSDWQRVERPEVRAAYGYLEGWTSIVLNVVLWAAKLSMGLAVNSISLIADAFHTLADVLTSIVVVAGFRVARRPPDEEHPYGHGRFETIATLVIAVLLVGVGIEFLRNSIDRFIHVQTVIGSYVVVLVLIASSVAKEWLARFAVLLGRRIDSSVLIADAWHHRSDAIAGGLVALALIAARFGYPKIDAIFGMAVSVLIAFTGLQLGRDAVSYLMGRAPSADFVSEIEKVAGEVNGVEGTHKVVVHDYGDQKAISLHIQVEKDLHVEDAHRIAGAVKQRLLSELGGATVEVHVEPRERQDDRTWTGSKP